MPYTIKNPVTYYSLPEDAAQAEAAFLSILHNSDTTYLEEYGDTLAELYAEIEKADANGVQLHLYLDHLQSTGPTEKAMLAEMLPKLKHTTVTIGTGGPDGEKSSDIAHRKRIMDVSGNVASGSVNASHDGFYSQTNDLYVFNDPAYVQQAIALFTARVAWARKTHPEWQIQPDDVYKAIIGAEGK